MGSQESNFDRFPNEKTQSDRFYLTLHKINIFPLYTGGYLGN
jgi:hypothetical protein